MGNRRTGEEARNVFVEELAVGGIAGCAGGVTPQGRDGQESAMRDEGGFVAGIFEWEVEIGS